MLGMEQKPARARFGAQVGLGDLGVFFLQQSCMEDLAVLAALPAHCSTCKPGKAGITHALLDLVFEKGLLGFAVLEMATDLLELGEGTGGRFVFRQIDLFPGILGIQAPQCGGSAF